MPPPLSKWLWHLYSYLEKRLNRTKDWLEMKSIKSKVKEKSPDSANENPSPLRLVCRCVWSQIMCWQPHYGIILLQSSTVETSWLNQSPKRPERQSTGNWDPVNWKWQWWFWLSPALPNPVKQRIWETDKNWGWSRTPDLKMRLRSRSI